MHKEGNTSEMAQNDDSSSADNRGVAPAPPGAPNRTWFGTLNNYSAQQHQMLLDIPKKYGIIAKEGKAEEKTDHLQFVITFTQTMRLAALKKICPQAHWEVVRNLNLAIIYCMKEGDYIIQDNKKQGQRTDLKEVVDFIKEKKGNQRAVLDAYPNEFLKYGANIAKVCALSVPPRDKPPVVVWISGETCLGKTRAVSDWCKRTNKSCWTSTASLDDFWNGYENQDVALFDDFRSTTCKFEWLIKILDRYPIITNIKGSYTQVNSDYIFITSCHTAETCYDSNSRRENVVQLTRRITKNYMLTQRGFVLPDDPAEFPDNPIVIDAPILHEAELRDAAFVADDIMHDINTGKLSPYSMSYNLHVDNEESQESDFE